MPAGILRGRGRPYGGVAIYYSNEIAHNVEPLDPPATKDIVHVKMGNCHIINVYLPGDNYRQSCIDPEFQEAIDTLDEMVRTSNASEIILGGDLNIDLSRNNSHTRCVIDFARRNNLRFIHQHRLANISYTYNQVVENARERISSVDHFLVSETVYDRIENIRCDSMNALNPSYHCPLRMNVTFDVDKRATIETESVTPQAPRVAWHAVTDNHTEIYHSIIRRKLAARRPPDVAYCNDCTCDNSVHREQVDEYASFLTDICIAAANECLPKVKVGRNRPLPYWNERIAALKEEALENFWIWEISGKPTSGNLFDSMRMSKRRYHYAIRSLKREELNLRNNRMAESLASGRGSDIFKEIKKADSKTRKPTNVDGIFDDQDIANLFADKNKALYNSVPSEATLIDDIRSSCQSKISAQQTFIFSYESVRKAVDKSKHNKSDGESALTSSHLKYAPPELLVHLSMLFSAMGRHGYVATSLLNGTITHIPKDARGSLRDSANYRGICLNSPIVKLLEEGIMDVYSDYLRTSDLQFAYKKEHSSSSATLTLKEVVRYYKLRNSCVFAAVLDASKAFDRVRHDKLYVILQDRGLPPIVLRLLIDLYERQKSRCRYFETFSDYYSIVNGVRQGGVASPILFIVYMDVLYTRLEQAGVGCYIGSLFYGMIGYADDIILLATTILGLNKILEVCYNFGSEFDVTYNATKSKFIVLGCPRNARYDGVVEIHGQVLTRVNEIEFLGNTIRSDLTEKSDVKAKVEDLFSRVNTIKYSLSGASYKVKSLLFNVKCAHAYGSEIWMFDDRSTREYLAAYGQGARRLLGVPPSCPSATVSSLLCCNGVINVIMKKFINLANNMKLSLNGRLKFIYDNAIRDARSIIRKNLAFVEAEWGNLVPPVFVPDDSQVTRGIRELIDARDGRIQLDLSPDEIDERMLLLCVR